MKKIVLALGGNALGNTPTEQKKLVKNTAKNIVDLIEQGNRVIITHGNGPQVGMINLSMELASKIDSNISKMPLTQCGAMTQGYIGFDLQNAILNELNLRKINKSVVSLVSQVLVDIDDDAFKNPTKPIGRFYTREESLILSEEKKYKFIEDLGRGYRRVVASPKPIDILEIDSIKKLVDSDCIVIACGGGGIPVVRENEEIKDVEAVIDKDFTSAKLAELVDADMLVILTAVEKVAIRFGQEDEEWLNKVSLEEVKMYLDNGEFGEGSMKPKVQAAINFSESKLGRKTLITSLEKAKDGILGKTGTIIE